VPAVSATTQSRPLRQRYAHPKISRSFIWLGEGAFLQSRMRAVSLSQMMNNRVARLRIASSCIDPL
jgi:hypothetical protein